MEEPVARCLGSVSESGERKAESGDVARRPAPLESGERRAESGDAARRPAPSESGDIARRPAPLESGEQDSRSAVAPGTPDDWPLDETETAVLQAVLNGEDGAAALQGSGRMLSVVIDGINEKLFDLFGDAAIYYEGDAPAVYEDYADELKGRMEQ